jgi:hypothetical protein
LLHMTRSHAVRALASLALVPAAGTVVALAADRIDGGDVKALNASLALERAAIKAYGDALAANILTPPVAAVLTRFQSEHTLQQNAIVRALTQASATVGTDVATMDPESFEAEADVLAYAYTLERSIANAYVTGISSYKNRDYATLSASILGVTTTHVALLAEALRRGAPYPTGLITV